MKLVCLFSDKKARKFKKVKTFTLIVHNINKYKKENISLLVTEWSSRYKITPNSVCFNALNLYEKYGFQHIEIKDTHFVTADIKMELKL